MSVNYRLTELRDNINRNRPQKGWYAQVMTKGTIDTRQLCTEIANKCTMTMPDMYAAIMALGEALAEKLQDGYNVYLDGIGTFSISAESNIVESPDQVKPRDVRWKSVNYRAAVELKHVMEETTFTKLKPGEERKYKYGNRYRR